MNYQLKRRILTFVLLCWGLAARVESAEGLRVALFDVDASPPIGTRMAYDPTVEVETPLSCRGMVLLGANKPIVLCALDWIGVANESHRLFTEALAKAAGTTPDRVAIHALHQHDAPWSDVTTEALLEKHDIDYRPFHTPSFQALIARTATAIETAVREAEKNPVITHLGVSSAAVEKVASNRRIMGPDGKVLHVRWSANKDQVVRDFPEGLIDPLVKMITLWAGEKPVVALTYYATHPQSYYRTGKANPDFPGIARNLRQTATGIPHIHFCGAGGNITAGKYNDGAHENRIILANRVADGMERALQSVKKTPLTAADVTWEAVPVFLPASNLFDEQKMLTIMNNKEIGAMGRFATANNFAYLKRAEARGTISISCLTLGNARVLHLPGELFVEYQLAAQELRPDQLIAMAAYGDYGPAYIGTEISYSQGGYETGPGVSHVGPEAEGILMRAIAQLLHVDAKKLQPLR